MRKQMLGTIIALLAVVLMAGAQTPDTEATATRAALQKVEIVPADGGISIEMTAKGTVTPKVSSADCRGPAEYGSCHLDEPDSRRQQRREWRAHRD